MANRMNLIAEVKEQTGEMKGLREIKVRQRSEKRSDYNALATPEGHEVGLLIKDTFTFSRLVKELLMCLSVQC